MRVLAVCLLIVFASCKSTTTSERLLGTWITEQDGSKHPKSSLSDKLTFDANGSFKVEMFLNDKLHEAFSGIYSLDENQKIITTKVGSVVTRSQIIELTGGRLSIKQENTKEISHYRRLKTTE